MKQRVPAHRTPVNLSILHICDLPLSRNATRAVPKLKFRIIPIWDNQNLTAITLQTEIAVDENKRG
jgi:hypothetical protein